VYSERRHSSCQDLWLSQSSEPLGEGGKSSFKEMPPVSRKRQFSLLRWPWNSRIREQRRKENSSLSFSNRERQMLQYRKYRKYSRRCTRRSVTSSDLVLFLID